ncbi:MAG: response regulator transcription factor [Methylobacter sp.]
MNTHKTIIAVVDDEESVCKSLERLLRSAGLTAKTFSTGADFLRFMKTTQPDCVVLDLNMPQMNGFEVLERLAMESSKLPVIIITGDDSEKAYERAVKNGISAYLPKPVDGEVLLNAIADAVGDGAETRVSE